MHILIPFTCASGEFWASQACDLLDMIVWAAKPQKMMTNRHWPATDKVYGAV
jgi:hypothetical protein